MRKFIIPVVAVLCMALIGAGSATAGSLITSAKIKNGTIKMADISTSAKNALRGNSGPMGPQGPAGPAGMPGPASLEGFKFDFSPDGEYYGSYMYTDKAENGDPYPNDGYFWWVPVTP